MATKECPSCGKIIEDDQMFCPACGTKLSNETKKHKTINPEFESALLNIENYAEVCLSKSLGAGIGGSIAYENLTKCEQAYLELITNYSTEAKAYLGYVDFMVKRAVKLSELTNLFARTQYFIGDINLQVNRCRKYLEKAKEYADDNNLTRILQLDSLVSSKLEALANDKTITDNQKKNVKSAKLAWIFVGILFGGLLLAWLIAELAGA